MALKLSKTYKQNSFNNSNSFLASLEKEAKENEQQLTNILTSSKKLSFNSEFVSCIGNSFETRDLSKLIEQDVLELEKKKEDFVTEPKEKELSSVSSSKNSKSKTPTKTTNTIETKKLNLLSDLKSDEDVLVTSTSTEIQLWEKKSDRENKLLDSQRKQEVDRVSKWENSKQEWENKIELSKKEFDSNFGKWYSSSSSSTDNSLVLIAPKTKESIQSTLEELKQGFKEKMEQNLPTIQKESKATNDKLEECFKNYSDQKHEEEDKTIRNLIKASSMIHKQVQQQEKEESSDDEEEYFSAGEDDESI